MRALRGFALCFEASLLGGVAFRTTSRTCGARGLGRRELLQPVSANTSVFAKLDVTFGEDLEGFGGKAGMRVSW